MMKTLIKAIYIYPDKRVEIHWNFKEEASYANVGGSKAVGQRDNSNL